MSSALELARELRRRELLAEAVARLEWILAAAERERASMVAGELVSGPNHHALGLAELDACREAIAQARAQARRLRSNLEALPP